MEFEGIDSKNQEYLKHIIPQLNTIFNSITNTKDDMIGENEVVIRREGIDEENRIIEQESKVYVPKYIPPIEVKEIQL